MRAFFAAAITLVTSVMMAACSSADRAFPVSSFGNNLHGSAVMKASQVEAAKASFLYIETVRCSRNVGFCIKEYASGKYGSPIRTIKSGLHGVTGMAFDKSANLYVANSDSHAVTVYKPGKTNVAKKLSVGKGDPVALVFDNSGNLYVANAAGTAGDPYIAVFKPGKTSLSRTFNGGIKSPHALAVDQSNNLYVGGTGKVWVFGPGQSTPKRTIADAVGVVADMIFDEDNSLYVANSRNSYLGQGSVTKYARNSSKLLKAVTNGVVNPQALALSTDGNLFVASNCYVPYSSSGCTDWATSVYSAGSLALARQITDGVQSPKSIAFGPGGYLFVANCGGCASGSVTVYAPGKSTVQQTIVGAPDAAGPSEIIFGQQ